MPRRLASAMPSWDAIPLSTVMRTSGERLAASRTISGDSPYAWSKRLGTMKSTTAPMDRSAFTPTAQAVAPSAS